MSIYAAHSHPRGRCSLRWAAMDTQKGLAPSAELASGKPEESPCLENEYCLEFELVTGFSPLLSPYTTGNKSSFHLQTTACSPPLLLSSFPNLQEQKQQGDSYVFCLILKASDNLVCLCMFHCAGHEAPGR